MQKGRFIFCFSFLFVFVLQVNDLFSEEGLNFYKKPAIYQSPLFPCSSCHAYMKTNPEKRQLKFHEDIPVLPHAPRVLWCLNCHDPDNRDKLRLINGERIDFKDLYRLCGQCHGSIFRDWSAGVHGKRVGYWSGKKRYFLCTYCHNPHSPLFKQLKPKPPPIKPENTLR